MHSVEEVAAENAAVYAALPADGVAIVNADDAHAAFFRARGRRPARGRFRPRAPAAVTGRYRTGAAGERARPAHARRERRRPSSPFPGLHNVRNALAAAAACASRQACRAETIGAGLSAFRPYSGRLQVKQASGGATRDRRQLQRQSRLGARCDRRARLVPGADGAGAGRHGRSRRRRAPSSTARSAPMPAAAASSACSRWATRRAHAVAGVRRRRAALRAARGAGRPASKRQQHPREGLALHEDGARGGRADRRSRGGGH